MIYGIGIKQLLKKHLNSKTRFECTVFCRWATCIFFLIHSLLGHKKKEKKKLDHSYNTYKSLRWKNVDDMTYPNRTSINIKWKWHSNFEAIFKWFHLSHACSVLLLFFAYSVSQMQAISFCFRFNWWTSIKPANGHYKLFM